MSGQVANKKVSTISGPVTDASAISLSKRVLPCAPGALGQTLLSVKFLASSQTRSVDVVATHKPRRRREAGPLRKMAAFQVVTTGSGTHSTLEASSRLLLASFY